MQEFTQLMQAARRLDHWRTDPVTHEKLGRLARVYRRRALMGVGDAGATGEEIVDASLAQPERGYEWAVQLRMM